MLFVDAMIKISHNFGPILKKLKVIHMISIYGPNNVTITMGIMITIIRMDGFGMSKIKLTIAVSTSISIPT